MIPRPAREGDECVVVACCNAGPVITLRTALADRRCPTCGQSGEVVGELVLGPGGSVPAPVQVAS